MSGWPRRAAALGAVLGLCGCAQLAPLRTPPFDPTQDLETVDTRAEAERRFGPPAEIRSSDVGLVLVYRRPIVLEQNPNRYYGEEDRADRMNRYERVLFYVDDQGRVVRRVVEPE